MKGQVKLAWSEVPIEVPADLTAHLAIHKALNNPGGWVVSHRPTGLAMAFVDLKRQATALAAMWEDGHGSDLGKLASLEFGKAPAKKTSAWSACRRLYRARCAWMAANG